MLRETSTAEAPWTIVEGEDERYRHLTIGKVLLEAMSQSTLERAGQLHRVQVLRRWCTHDEVSSRPRSWWHRELEQDRHER